MQQRRVPDEDQHPCRRVQVCRVADVYLLDAEHRRRTWPAQVDSAQRVERDLEHRTMHGCYHRLRDARWGADCVLEVARVSTHYERAAV